MLADRTRFRREEEGATMVEYSLMLGLIAVVLIVVISILAQSFKGSYARTNTAVTNSLAVDATATVSGPVAAP